MKFGEYLIAGMSTFLDDNPEALAVYAAYQRLMTDTVLWAKIQARERFLTDQWLIIGQASEENKIKVVRVMQQRGASVAEITEMTGLSPSEIERLG